MRPIPLSPVALKATGFFSKQTNTFSANAAKERLKLLASSKMSLEEFIKSDLPNGYIKYKTINSYYRKGKKAIEGKLYNTLTRANTTNSKRSSNIKSKDKYKSTGLYKELDDLTLELAKKYGFEAVYVEGVLNEFLPEKLEEYGYTRKVDNYDIVPNFYKLLANEDQYGYWFTDEGLRLDVDEMQHDSVASKVIAKEHYKEYFSWVETVDQADYKQFAMKVLGWIRVTVTGSTLGVEIYPGAVSDKAYRAFTKFVNSEAVVDEYLLDIVETSSRFLPASRKQALLNDIKKQIKKNTLEADDFGIPSAWWITDKGRVLEVEKEHDLTALPFFPEVKETYRAISTALKAGWIRMRSYGEMNQNFAIEFEHKSLSPRAISSFRRFMLDFDGLYNTLTTSIYMPNEREDYKRYDPYNKGELSKVVAVLLKNKGANLESMDLIAKETKERITNNTVLYHGTSRDFDKFSVTSERNPTTPKDEVNAIFFTDDPVVAYGHANRMRKAFGGKIRIIKVNLDFKNMYDATNVIKKAKKEFGVFGTAKRAVYAKVDRSKFDGISFRGDAANTPEYVVFNPDIIKILNEDVKLTAQEMEDSDEPYGYWFTDKGEKLVVNSYKHDIVAEYHIKENYADQFYEYLEKNNIKSHNASHKLYAMKYLGWIRWTNEKKDNSINIEIQKENVAVNAFNRFNKHLKDVSFKAIRLDVTGSKELPVMDYDNDTKAVVREVRKNINKTIIQAAINEPYGYWITPKGELLKVENDLVGHIGVLQKYSKANDYGISKEDWETIDDADYWPVLSRGWIRIVFERFNDMGIEIAKKSVSPAAAKKLSIYIRGLKDKNFTIDVNKSAGRYEIDYEDTTSKAKILSVIEQNIDSNHPVPEHRLEAAIKPYLIPAMRYNGKIYKGKKHSSHDRISLPDGQDEVTLDSEDVGFINDKGKFLDRKEAKDYAVYNNLISEDILRRVKNIPYLVSEWLIKSKTVESSIKHNITITADNEIIDHSVEETIETWRTDTGLRLLLIYNGKDYFIREFSENNVMVNEQAWAFLETARQSLLGIVRLAQDSGVFFKRESEMTAEDTVLQRWEASDKKYAIELVKSDTGAMAVSNFIKGDITQAWHKVGTSYLGKRTEEDAMVRVQEDIDSYKATKGGTFKKVKAASTEKPRAVKKSVEKVETRTNTKDALPPLTETVKIGAAQILRERKDALKKAFSLVEKGYPIPEAIKDIVDRDKAYVKMEISKKYARRGAKDIKAPRIEPPPSEHDRRMVGSYVVGLDVKGKPVRGMLLTQRKDKVKRHYGWIAVLNEDNKPSRIEVTNVTRTLTKPPKDLVKAYEYMAFKIRTTMSRS